MFGANSLVVEIYCGIAEVLPESKVAALEALRGVVNAFDISKRTMRNIRQNQFWAIGYNTLLIPVAAGVLYPINGLLLSPVLAAAAMSLSSAFVLSNALRLRWVKPVLSEPDRSNPGNDSALLSSPVK